MNLLLTTQLLLALAGTVEGAPRAARLLSFDAPAGAQQADERFELLEQRRKLLDDRPSLKPEVTMMILSTLAGVIGGVLWGVTANPPGSDWGRALFGLSAGFLAVLSSAAHLALGVVSSVMLPRRLCQRARIDAEVARIDARLRQAEGTPRTY